MTDAIMVRALIEGVGFAYADCLERMRALGIEPPSVMLTGGGARGELWRTILAAQLRVPLATGTAAEGPGPGRGDPGPGGQRRDAGPRTGGCRRGRST